MFEEIFDVDVVLGHPESVGGRPVDFRRGPAFGRVVTECLSETKRRRHAERHRSAGAEDEQHPRCAKAFRHVSSS